MSRPRRSLPRPDYVEPSVFEQLRVESQLASPRKPKAEDSSNAESKMRKRHQEEAAELAQLNHELVTLKSDITVTAQVNDKLEELAGNIKVLKEINYDLMMERARHCDNARKMHKSINDTKKETKAMKKSVEDAKDETKAMKSRLDDMGKVYNELIRDMYYERGKRVQVEQTLQEFLAAQKAIAEKFGARLV